LESQIAIAKNAKQKAAIARHAAINRKSWPKLRAAIEAAVNAQAELIRQREEAVRDVGEHAVTLHLPVAAFAGFLHREHFDIWAKELDRVMAEPAPKSAPAPVAAVVTAKPVAKNPVADVRTSADSRESAAEPAKPRPLRQPRRDKVSVGGRLVTILRTGVEIGDQQLHAGDQISVSMEQAEQLLRNGAAELVSAAS
jgi:hypothetical protein